MLKRWISRGLVIAGCVGLLAVSAARFGPAAGEPDAASATVRTDHPEPAAGRGELVSVTSLGRMDTAQVTAYLREAGLDASRVRAGVEAHRIVYRTVDPDGRPTTASGLVALPSGRTGDLRLVTWLHGTTVYRGEVASVNAEGGDRRIAFAFASAGYAVSAPDYLGLGVGPGTHPFRDPSSEVTASVDALRATHQLAERLGRSLDPRVLATGHSQGGTVTMALGRALQEDADPRLRLAALAPISGPYDTSGTLQTALSGRINLATGYLAYLVVSWNRLHHLYDTPAEAFRAPYDRTLVPLLDNNHTPDQILPNLPETPEELFTPGFLQQLRHPTGSLAKALEEADSTCDWAPKVPVRLYAARGDQDVPISNEQHCLEVLRTHGATAELVDVGNVDHSQSAILSTGRVIQQFDTLTGTR